MVKQGQRRRLVAVSSPPNTGAAAPAADSTGGKAKAAYLQYVKGKRREGLEILEKAHAESPSAATCLVGAKLFVLDAAEAAFKDDVSDDVREAAVLRHLHRAMDFAACGAVEHLSISCLQLLCLLLFCTEGRPGWAERKPLCERVRTALIAGGGLDAPGNALAARPWLAFGSEAEGLERWQFEDNLSDRSQQEIVREVCGKAREKVDTCLMLDTVAGWAGGDGVPIIVNMDSEHRMSPADVRMTEVYLLPDKLDSHLRRRRAHKRHVAAQGRQQAGQEPAAHSAPSTAHLPEQVLKRRRQELPGLKARAAKIRDFLLSRAAAAGVEGGAGGAAAPRSLQRGSDEGVCPGSQLAALLAQTELGEQELKAQLEQQREHTSAAQRQAALAGLRRARGGQALSCALPALLVDVLTRLLPPAKTAPLLAEQQRNCDAGAPAAAQAQRLAQQLHELAWEAEGPRLGDAQLPAVLRSSSILRDIHKAGLMPRGRTAQRNVAISLPDLASLEVLPECPGDLELLGQGGAATGGPLPMVLGMLHGLQPGEAGGAGSAHGAGDRPAGTSPQTVRSIDSDEEFWPGGSGGLASGERSPGGDAEAPGASSPGQRSGQQLAARNRPLAVLETSLRRHAMSGWVLEALLDLGPLEFSHLRLASLDGRSMRQLSCSRLLCALLLGLELLELLDRQEEAQQAEQAAAGQPRAAEADEAPGAAGAAEAPGAAGQTGGAPSDALVARLARLTVAGWASKDLIDPMALADALAESGPQAEGLKLALAGAIRTELPAAAGFLVLGGLLFDEVEEHAGMMRALRQDSTPIARHYVLQARRRLCRRILLGLQAMQQARCLTPSLLATLRNFLLLATSAADAGNDDGSDSGSKGGGPGGADAGAAGLGSEPHDGVSLEGLGRLPLQHLMELCAFLATLLGCEFSTPAALVPELHAAMLNCRMPAEVTPTGGVRLTADGLQALGTEVEAMEAFRQSREAPKAACRTLVEHALAAPEAGACCGDVKAAADLLAAYSCGVPHAEAEVARRVMAAGVDAHLQSLHAAPALMLLRGMQRLACVHTLLAGLAGSAARALQETYSLVEQLEGVLGPLGQVTALRGPPEPALRAHLAGRLFALRDSLDSQLEEHNTIAQAAWETQLGLRRELKQYEERLLRQEEQRAAAQAELLAPASPERRKLAKRQKELALALAAVSQELQLSGFEEFSNPGLTARDRDVVRRAMQLSGVLARELKAADDAEGSAARQVQGGLLDALRSLRDILAMQASSLDADLRSLQAVADCAAVHVETCAGQLVYAHCLRPSLEPACRALTRHLLGAKWGAELQARQVAEEEARRQAALQALLEEEEEQGGSAAAQAKGEQKRAKKKAKKAAKKEGAAASGQAEPQQQAGPKHAELMQDSRQHEQEAGLQRLLQQMEQEQEEQLRKQREQQQQEREQEEQERQQREEQQQEREQEEQQRQQREEQQQQRQREQEEQEQRREQELPEQQVQQHKLQKLHKLHKQGQEQQQPPLEGQANAAATTDALLGGEEAEQQQQQQQEAAQPKQDSRASTANAQNGRKRVGQPAAMQPAGAAAQAGAAGGQQLQAPASADLLAEQERHEQPSQLPGHKIAAAAPEHYQEEEEEGVWQQAASSSRRGGRAGKRASGPPAPPPQPRPAAIVSWEGHWRCACGSTVPPRTNCRDCGERNPCREYVFGGGCSRGGPPSCMFPHPPFDLPPGARPPAGRSLVAPPAGLALHGCVLPPSVARPGARAAAAAKPGQPTSPEAKVPSPRTARGAATVAPRHAGSRAWQPSGPAPPSLAAVTEGPPAPATPATGPLGSSASGRAWPQDQAAAPHEAPRGSADTAVPAGRDDADLASLLGMMGLDSEDQEAAAAAALGEAASSTTRGLLPVPAAASSWAQRAVARISAEPADAIPTAAAEAAAWPAPGQSQEDAELEAAIQASLAEAAAAAGSALQPDRGSPAAAAAVPSENGLGLAGLRNEAGEYNCFLNVIVQCLWRCTAFRRQVAGWDSAFCISEPVVQCLHTLFHQFQRQERELQSEAAQGGAPPPVDPTPLRRALAALPGQHFRVGEMNDAAEVLLAIYERVIEAAAGLGRSAGIEPTFGLSVREEVHCPRCGKTTHQSEYTQYFYNTQATVLHMLSDACGSSLSTGQLLREAEAQHQKSCDEDVGGCGRPCPVNHFLQHAPRVFTLQLAWESQSEQPADIAGTLAAIDEEVDLGEVYQGAERGAHRYRLRSMVCYYGQHYQALVLVPEAGGWLVFDDTRVARVGSWEAVRHKCEAGRIQPSVLFYEATS